MSLLVVEDWLTIFAFTCFGLVLGWIQVERVLTVDISAQVFGEVESLRNFNFKVNSLINEVLGLIWNEL